MRDIIRFVKKLFGKYETGYEYWVYTKDIKVPSRYKQTRVGTEKWNHKMKYWLKTGEFESPIILHRNFTLADGYSSVKMSFINI